MNGEHPVIAGLRRTLAAASASAFVDALESRIRQLRGNMVDGRVVPRQEADALRAGMLELVGSEALALFAGRNPNDSLRLLDKLKAYGHTELEGRRAALEAALAARFPPPPAAAWPVLAELRAAAALHPEVCSIASPAHSMPFVHELKENGLELPEDLLALYAWADGFDLSCLAATYLPVFSFLPSRSIDVSEAEADYPRRAAVFQGGDEVQFSVYRHAAEQWRLVYEYEYQPVASRALDVPALIRFGLRRMKAPNDRALGGDLSWDRFFETEPRADPT